MKLKLSRTITLKLILISLCVQILVLGLLGGNLFRLLKVSLSEHLEEHVAEITPLLNSALAPLLFQRDIATLNDYVVQTLDSSTHGFQYLLIYDDLDQLYIYKGDVDPNAVPVPKADFWEGWNEHLLHVEAPLLLAGQKIGRMQFGLSTQGLDQICDQFYNQTLLAAAASVLLLIFATVAIGYFFLRHTKQFLCGMRELTAGDYSVELNSSRNDEFGFVAKHFNQLSAAIRERTEDLTRSEQQFQQLAGEYANAQESANISSWKLNLQTGELVSSEQLAKLLCVDPHLNKANYTDFLQAVFPADRETVDTSYQQAAQQKGQFSISHRIACADGTIRWLTESGLVVREEKSGQDIFVGIVQDITEKKLADERIQESYRKIFQEVERRRDSEARLKISQQIVATVSEPLAFIDREYVYRNVNPVYCRYNNLSAEEIEGHTIEEQQGEEKFNQLIKPQIDKALDGEAVRYEDWFTFAGMGRRFMIVEYSPVRAEDGDISGVTLSMNDITERKQAETELQGYRDHLEQRVNKRTEELAKTQKALEFIVADVNSINQELATSNEKLKELDKLKSMFIASMSHELRTPLNAIIGFSSLVLNGMTGEINEQQRDQLERVYRSGKHLLGLITDIIDISKIESGRVHPYPTDFSLAEMIDEACDSLKLQIAEKQLSLIKKNPDISLGLHTDRKRLLQCLLNYLSNAVKFTEQGQIELSVEADPETITFCIADSGIGISEKDLPSLFQSFVRLDSPLKITIPGTGLGLYLTKKLAIEVLGGEVWAESTENQGSRFYLKIPQRISG